MGSFVESYSKSLEYTEMKSSELSSLALQSIASSPPCASTGGGIDSS